MPPDATTFRLPIAVLPPMAPVKVTIPLPACTSRLLKPLTVEPNTTLRFVLVMVVPATNVTAPPKLILPDVAVILPPSELTPVTVIEPASIVTPDASVSVLNTASCPLRVSVEPAVAVTSPNEGQLGQLKVPP